MPTTHHESESHAEPDLAQVARDVHEAYPAVLDTHEASPHMTTTIDKLTQLSRQLEVDIKLADPETDRRVDRQYTYLLQVIDTINDDITRLQDKNGVEIPPSEQLDAEEGVWYYNKVSEGLDWGNISLPHAQNLLAKMVQIEARRSNFYDTSNYLSKQQLVSTLDILSTKLPADLMRDVYASEDPEKFAPIHALLSMDQHMSEQTPQVAAVLAKVYRSSGGLDRVKQGEDSTLDRLRPYITDIDMALLSIPEKPKALTPEGVFEYEHDVTKRAIQCLRQLDLPEGFITTYWHALRPSLMKDNGDSGLIYLDHDKVRDHLHWTWSMVYTRGIENIKHIYKEFGMVNLYNYNPEDLEALTKLSEKDPQFIKQLQEGDVTAIFIDGRGDYNGAFNDMANTYRKPDGKSLIFEIHSSVDMYRYMLYLKKRDIRPSTIVIGAHGAPGETTFGQSKWSGGFTLLSDTAIGSGGNEQTVGLDRMNLKRLLSNEFVQPNKGVDSSKELEGRVQVIINSCSSDVAFSETITSTAEAVVRGADRQDLDVFAASGVLASPSADKSEGMATFFEWDYATNDVSTNNIGSKLSLDPGLSIIKRTKSRRQLVPVGPTVKRTVANYVPVSKPEVRS